MIINLLLGNKYKLRKKLIKEYLTEKEQVKMTLFTLLWTIAPFGFAYLFLVINGSLIVYGTRAFFYIPFFLAIAFSIRKRYLMDRYFLNIAIEREENKNKLKLNKE